MANYDPVDMVMSSCGGASSPDAQSSSGDGDSEPVRPLPADRRQRRRSGGDRRSRSPPRRHSRHSDDRHRRHRRSPRHDRRSDEADDRQRRRRRHEDKNEKRRTGDRDRRHEGSRRHERSSARDSDQAARTSSPSPPFRRPPSGPDMRKVMERVERLRRQGCTAAYEQIMSGVQQPLSSRPNLAPHQQPPLIPPPSHLPYQQRHSAPLISRPPPLPLGSASAAAAAAAAAVSCNVAASAAACAEIPKFYNPAAINVAKIADQERKKKLLWGNKSQSSGNEASVDRSGASSGDGGGEATAKTTSAAAWKPVAAFEQDDDGKVTAKFLRLMGVKNVEQSTAAAGTGSAETVERQRRMFDDMEHQYEQARASTHTQRGFGLGYTAQYYMPKS